MPRSTNPYYSGLPSDHFDGLRFFNPDHPDTDRGLSDLLRWKLKGTAAPWPRSVPVRQTIPDACIAGLRATIVGHASVLIQAGGINVLTAPQSPSQSLGSSLLKTHEITPADRTAARAVSAAFLLIRSSRRTIELFARFPGLRTSG